MFPDDQINELRGFCSRLYTANEAGTTYILMEEFVMPEGTNPAKVNVLFCPFPRDGYPSRIFYEVKVQSPRYDGLNWNATSVRILERNWNAYSWKINRPGLRLAQIVSDHINAKK